MLQLVLVIQLERTGASQPSVFYIFILQMHLVCVEYVLLLPGLKTD